MGEGEGGGDEVSAAESAPEAQPLGACSALYCRRPRPPLLQELLDGDLLVFSPHPSLSALLRDSGLAQSSRKACEAAW